MDEIEAGGIPVVMLRGDGQMNPDGVRDFDLLVPATVEALVTERHAAARDAYRREADGLAGGVHPRARRRRAAPAPVRALLQRVSRAASGSTTRRSARSGRGWRSCWASDPTTRGDRRRPGAQGRRAPDLPRRRGPDEPLAPRRRRRGAGRLPVHALRGHAAWSPARLHGAAPPDLAERLYERFAEALRALGVAVATGRFGAEMAVELVNDGPFTIWLDTDG